MSVTDHFDVFFEKMYAMLNRSYIDGTEERYYHGANTEADLTCLGDMETGPFYLLVL